MDYEKYIAHRARNKNDNTGLKKGYAIKMYIPAFWCGVAATLLAELAALVGHVIYARHKDKN